MTRSHPEFVPSSIGPNAQAERYGDLLVRRVRDLVDSNPIIDGALLTFQNEVLGTGIVAQPNTGNDRVNRLIEDAWHEFAEGVDVDRSMSIYESQRLALAEYWSGGEGFHHFSVTDAHRGRPSGPCITIIPRERLPLHDSWMSRAVNTESDGSILRQSIRMDRLGRVLSYRVLDADPADNVWVAPNTRDIPSSDIMHMYRRRRAEQLRGLPTPLTAVLMSQDVDALVEASVYLARMVSAMGLVVKSRKKGRKIAPSPTAGEEALTELDGSPVGRPYPGFVWVMDPDDDVKVVSSTTPAPAVEQFSRVLLRSMAAGLGISYARISRDYSQSNYSSTRQEELGDRRGYTSIQWMLWAKHDYPLYQRWLRWELTVGKLAGKISLPKFGAKILEANPLMPGWSSVDPAKDTAADEADLRMGVVSPQTIAAKRGLDWRVEMRKTLEAEAEERKVREELGLPEKAATPASTSPSDTPSNTTEDDNQDDKRPGDTTQENQS